MQSDANGDRPGRLCHFRPESIQEMLDGLKEGILAVDDRLVIIAHNRAAIALTGRSAGELADREVCEVFGRDSCPLDCLRQTLSTGEAIADYQTTLDLPDGSRRDVLLRTVALHAPDAPDDAPPSGAALILGDVSEVTSLRKEVGERHRFGAIVGRNRAMRVLYGLIEDIAASQATVLIRGETGTGKELVARALHFAGPRAGGPFVMVNCSALSESLLESELFGHVRGAFTGAVADRRGRFEEARDGTIFLDEIGDVSPVVQVKLLRVLQERVVERVGDNRPIPVDVRVVSATNKDLDALRATGRIREDFYYRIKVVALDVPPLRERREDIPLLLNHFLERHPEASAEIDPEALRLLLAHDWPGNVRELENAVEHAVILARGGPVLPGHLPPEIVAAVARGASGLRAAPPHSEREKRAIAAALASHGWNRTRTARHLGIDRTTLWRKIREYGLEREED